MAEPTRLELADAWTEWAAAERKRHRNTDTYESILADQSAAALRAAEAEIARLTKSRDAWKRRALEHESDHG